jgi:cyclic pyranopterin phosphate synthase
MNGFSHIDDKGLARMVDVGKKDITHRVATSSGTVRMKPETIRLLKEGRIVKGEVLNTAKVAGVLAAKRVAELIPMCHQVNLSHIDIRFDILDSKIDVWARIEARGKTGVEIEALTAVAISCLTIYDMCKAKDHEMVITDIKLVEKIGGRSGKWLRSE